MPLGTRLGVTLSMVNNVARDSSNDDDDQYWLYDPSRKLADVAAVVFAVLGIAHLILLIIRRYWFCLPYALGALRMLPDL